MKRNSQVLRTTGLGSAWSGLAIRPSDVPTVTGSQPPEPASFSIGFSRTCDFCEQTIGGDVYSCNECDAGPFHQVCLIRHLPCPFANYEVVTGGDEASVEEVADKSDSEDVVFSGEVEVSSVKRPKNQPPIDLAKSPVVRAQTGKFASAKQFSEEFMSFKTLASFSTSTLAHVSQDSIGKETGAGGSIFRKDQPRVKEYARADPAKTAEALADQALFDAAWEQFQKDKVAESNRGPNESKKKWWPERATAMGVEPFPLTIEKVDICGTLLKFGMYRSSSQYLAAAKQEHISLGYDWSGQLEQRVKQAVLSCTRGLGPDKTCPSFDLMKVFDLPDIKPCAGGPRFPKETVIVFAHFACREVEAACRTRADISFQPGSGCGTVSFWLPASKTDPKGNGALRRHGCTCSVAENRCPVRAAKRIFDQGTKLGATSNDPFLGTESIKVAPTKPAMIETFRLVAKQLEWSDSSCKSMTGHVLRATGAQYLARCGVEYYKIQLFCRWGSDTVLRYLRDAPLYNSEEWIVDSINKSSLHELVSQTAFALKLSDSKVDAKEVDKIVVEALESRASEIIQLVEKKYDDMQEMVESLKEKKIQMDDAWANELSRRFLPKFVINLASGKVHAVRDELATGCGFEWRSSRDFDLLNKVPVQATRCETAGCQKLFSRWE